MDHTQPDTEPNIAYADSIQNKISHQIAFALRHRNGWDHGARVDARQLIAVSPRSPVLQIFPSDPNRRRTAGSLACTTDPS